MIAPGHFQNRAQTRSRPPGTNARQTLMHQNAVVGIQRHYVGHAAQRDQIQQFTEVRLRALRAKPAHVTQPCAQRQQHIKHHTNPGQCLAGERATRLVRVDDGIRHRQLGAGQVVVGDQHSQTRRLGRRHTLDAGNAVIHGNQQLRRTLKRHRDNFRGQAVAIFEAIGHQVIDVRRTQHAQTEHPNCAGGGTVGIEVAHDQHALALLQPQHQQIDRRLHALELLIRNQPRQAFIQLGSGLHATGGIQTGQQRRQSAQIRQGGG